MASQMQVWRVVRGITSDLTFEPVRLVEDEKLPSGRAKGTYYPGDVFRSDKDLRVHNRGTRRFDRLNSRDYKEDDQKEIAEDTANSNLDTMTIADLKNFAEELDVDLSGINKKQDLIEAITKAKASEQ